MIEDPFRYSRLLDDGSILMGDSVVCDGYDEGRTTGVFTHIHTDHIAKFSKALGRCDKILASNATYKMLVALQGEPLKYHANLIPVDFNSPYYNKYDEKITLYPSNHILGSSQVLVETSKNLRILYSSDFNFPEMSVIHCDILVLDSTHGDPRFDSIAEHESLERRLVDLVKEEIESGRPVMIRSHRGRMQYVMSLLHRNLIGDVKFLADEKDLKLAQIYNEFGLLIREIIKVNNNPAAYRIRDDRGPYVWFHTISGPQTPEEESGMRTIRLSSDVRLLGGAALKEHSANNFSIEISDHASFSNILKYVKAVNPQVVITDNARTKSGVTLADKIREIGIVAHASPSQPKIMN